VLHWRAPTAGTSEEGACDGQAQASKTDATAYDNDGNRLEWGGRFGIESEVNAPGPDDDLDDPKWDEPIENPIVLGPVEDDEDDGVYEIPISDADAALIEYAPTDLAALIAEVERLQAQLGEST
jgi:hypothetical protein